MHCFTGLYEGVDICYINYFDGELRDYSDLFL